MKTTYQRILEKIASIGEYSTTLPEGDLEKALGIKRTKRIISNKRPNR